MITFDVKSLQSLLSCTQALLAMNLSSHIVSDFLFLNNAIIIELQSN